MPRRFVWETVWGAQAAEAAAKAKTEANAKSAPMPPLPPPLAPAAAAVVPNSSVEWAPVASPDGCAFELTETTSQGHKWLPAALQRPTTRALLLRAPSQPDALEWVTALRRLARTPALSS
jgi:hypothetical protein